MSSYVESAFSIERRRLQGIVNQCEKELENALCKLATKKQEKEQARNIFQTNTAIGRRTQGDNRKNTDIQKSILVNNIRARCEFLQKTYFSVIDETVKRKLDEIILFATHGDVREELLMSMLSACEEQLDRRIHQDNVVADKYKVAHLASVTPATAVQDRRRGIKIGSKKQNPLEGTTAVKEEFEQKLEIIKSFDRYKKCEELLQIEKEFITQPDFAKELYAQQNIARLDAYIQEELRKKEQASESDGHKEALKKQYEVLIGLTGSENDQSIPDVDSLDNISAKSIETYCEKLQSRLIEMRKKEYVSNAVRTVMQRHGIACCTISDNVTLPQSYQYDENIDFNISGISQNRFISEINGKFYGKTPTLDERRKSVGSAKKACEFLRAIREELAKEFGIIFDEANIIEPSEKSIVMKNISGNHFEQTARYSDREQELMLEE